MYWRWIFKLIEIAGFMSETSSPILIYGICETPKLVLDAYYSASNIEAVNRQYICLNDAQEDIKIGDKGWLELLPDQLLQFEKNKDIFIFAKEMLLSKTHPFNKPLRNAIVSYLNWVKKKSAEFHALNEDALTDPLFSNPDQICFSAFLPLPHPKVPVCKKNSDFEGAANFDLGFHIAGKTYVISFSSGEFIRKHELELRVKLSSSNNNLILLELAKPVDNLDIDHNFINNLLSSIPEIANFPELGGLPHGLYYPAGLRKLLEIR